MPGAVIHLGAFVTCTHAGPATPTAAFARVLVSGQPVVTLGTPYAVIGCALTGTPAPPCLTGQWLAGAVRVLAGGTPVAVVSGTSTTTPAGTPMLPLAVQPRVVAA